MKRPRTFFRDQGRDWRKRISLRLRSAKGFDGRRLKPKVIPNGRSLGFHGTTGGVPGRVQRAAISPQQEGWIAVVATRQKDQWFDEGRARQAPRRYADISSADQARYLDEAIQYIYDYGISKKVFKR